MDIIRGVMMKTDIVVGNEGVGDGGNWRPTSRCLSGKGC